MMNQEIEAVISIRKNLAILEEGTVGSAACPLPAEAHGPPEGGAGEPLTGAGGEGEATWGGRMGAGDQRANLGEKRKVWRGWGESVKRFVNNLGSCHAAFSRRTF